MAKKYFVWADANCNGENIEWIELTFPEFKEFRKRPENKQRKFIELSDHLFHECDTVFIEATQEQYRDWKKEDNHLYYVHTVEEQFIQYSFDFSMNEEDELTFHDLIPNEEATNFIEEIENYFTAERFMHAFAQLSDSEKEFLATYVSLINEGNSERAVCRILGIPKSTYRDRKEKILKKLKKVPSNL